MNVSGGEPSEVQYNPSGAPITMLTKGDVAVVILGAATEKY